PSSGSPRRERFSRGSDAEPGPDRPRPRRSDGMPRGMIPGRGRGRSEGMSASRGWRRPGPRDPRGRIESWGVVVGPNAIETKIRHLPTRPGVYLFRDEAGEILYIGKANSL